MKLDRHAFVCPEPACGYGQRGDRGDVLTAQGQIDRAASLEAGREWDGVTFVNSEAGKDPTCPNLLNHPGQRPKTEVEVLRDQVAALTKLVNSGKAAGGKS